MTQARAALDKTETVDSESICPERVASRPGLMSLFFLSAWCGLVAGLLEVAAIVVRKRFIGSNHLYGMSRHFVWLIPLTNLAIVAMLGVVGSVVFMTWGRRRRAIYLRLLCSITLLPPFLAAGSQIYSLAWIVMTLGLAARLVPLLERHARLFRVCVYVSFPIAFGILVFLGANIWTTDRDKIARENARPSPPPGSPNVLLIVMDTVAAGHLSLHGYDRATTKTLAELARNGIWFERCAVGGALDAPVTCDDVYRAMDARPGCRLAHAA